MCEYLLSLLPYNKIRNGSLLLHTVSRLALCSRELEEKRALSYHTLEL